MQIGRTMALAAAVAALVGLASESQAGHVWVAGYAPPVVAAPVYTAPVPVGVSYTTYYTAPVTTVAPVTYVAPAPVLAPAYVAPAPVVVSPVRVRYFPWRGGVRVRY